MTFGFPLWKLFRYLHGTNQIQVLVLGLDNSGKTTLLHSLRFPKKPRVSSKPTIGFNVIHLDYKLSSFRICDVAGQAHLRSLWQHYYQGQDVLIYAIDASDTKRVEEAAKEFFLISSHPLMKSIPILILANKRASEKSVMSLDFLKEKLCLDQLSNLHWHLMYTDAASGEHMKKALKWITETVNAKTEMAS